MALKAIDSAKAAIAGFAMMVLEVAGARLLYPFFGSSMLIWASIIGMFMLVLATGYWLGAKLSPRKDAEELVGRALLASGAFVVLLPFLAGALRLLPIPWQILLPLAAALVSVPALSLSLVSPVIIEKIARGHAGVSAGKVYAVSTAGSIAGTFLPAFAMLPFMGVAATLSAAGFLMMALAALFIKKPSGAHFVLAAAALALFTGYSIAQPFGIPTYFYTAEVIDVAGIRYLFMDGWTESALNLSSYPEPALEYARVMKQQMALLPAAKRLAIIGAGGCTQAYHAASLFPDAQIDVVDIDSKVFDICRTSFYMNESEKLTFRVEDGRKFLEENGNYDIILMDAFSSGCNLPPHMGSAEFFATASRALSKNGTLLANVIVKSGGPAHHAFCSTVFTAFSNVTCEPLGKPGSLVNLIIAAENPRATPLQALGPDVITDDRNPIEASYGLECVSS